MPYLSKKRVWTQQPQHAVEIDWANPITQGLVLSMSPVNGFADVVTGEQYIPFGTAPVISTGAFGKCLDSTAAFGGLYITPARNLCVAEQTHIIFVDYVSSSGSYAGLIVSATANGNSYSSTFQDNSGGFFSVYPTGTTLPSNIPFGPSMIVISGDASGSSAYKDGEIILASGPAPTVQSNSRLVLFGERSASSGYASKGRIYFHASFTRRLSVAEIKSITRNPWQVFKKQDRRIWVPSAGGGSSTNLIIQDSTHSLLSDNLDLSTSLLLTIQDSTHSLISDNLILNTTGSTDLIIQEATHSLTSDNLLITTEWLLDIASAAHALTSDNLDLSTALSIIIQNAIHSHTADNLVLDTSNTTFLTIQDAVHNHTADNLDLTLDTWLVIANAVHSHLADSIDLGTELTLTIQDSTHNLTSDIIILSIPSTGSCPTVEEIVAAIMIQIEAKNYLTLPQFLSFK